MVAGAYLGTSTKLLQVDAGREGGGQCSGGPSQRTLISTDARSCSWNLSMGTRTTIPKKFWNCGNDDLSTWFLCCLSLAH